MFGNLGLIAFAWLTARFVYGVDFALLAEGLPALIAAQSTTLFMAAGLGAVGLPAVSLLCRGIGLYSAMYLLDKFFFWLGQFLVALVSCAAVLFWFTAEMNLWTLLGSLALVPFLVLGSAAFSLKLFDFNYPLKETLIGSLGLPVVSWLIIWGSQFSRSM
jgi:hypothetical protein